jgi:glycosyltransferase involved in cell wall biosynthesis
MTVVSIVQRVLPHYRISFVKELRADLQRRGIELQLIYGQERQGTVPKTAPFDEPWARRLANAYFALGSHELVWQPCLQRVLRSDLVVVEQSNRLLVNYALQLRRVWSQTKFAFWGHGANLQSRRPDGARERLKSALMRYADWWFAYTELSKEIVLRSGFPAERISVLNNATDDAALRRGMERVRHLDRAAVARSIGCSGRNIALYCGSLHGEKRLDFLLTAARAIRRDVPDFELLIVGDGPLRPLIEQAARREPWILFKGRVPTDEELAPYFHSSKLLLMPGLVGLVIVDSFVGECPMVTTDYPHHSVEIAYLRPGENGLITSNDPPAYARAIVECLGDDARLELLRAGCRRSAERYTLGGMVGNFADGIEACLRRN